MEPVERVTHSTRQGPREIATPSVQPDRRKPIVRPELIKHGSLPDVTGAFIGTFSP